MSRSRAGTLAVVAGLGGLLSGCGGGDSPTPAGPGDSIPPAVVADLLAVGGAPGVVILTLTAPGDDDTAGRAAGYELRWHPCPADPADWSLWDTRPALPAPGPAGAADTLRVDGLAPDTVAIFRLRTVDEAGNWSGPSNPVIATAADRHDTTPPAAIGDLDRWASDGRSVTLVWSAPGDDGPYGAAAAYACRFAETPVTEENWDAAEAVPLPADLCPGPAGARDRATVTGLAAGSAYWFAVRTRDEAGNWSGVSNSLRAVTERFRTWYVTPDGTGDAATIAIACVDSARPGDVVLLAPGRYTWTNQGAADPRYGMITFLRDQAGFTLRGEAGADQTIIDAERQGRVFFFQGISPGSDVNTTCEGLTITGGDAYQSELGEFDGGGVEIHLCSPTFRNCVFRGNRADYGGGFAQCGVGSPILIDCLFEDNQAEAGGGIGLYTYSSFPEIRGCVLRRNTAALGGGGLYAGRVTLTMTDCLVHGNGTADKGGGLYLVELGAGSRLEGCTVADNAAATGGNLRLAEPSRLTVTRSIFAFATSGGGIRALGANVLAMGCCDVFGNVGGDDLPAGLVDLGDLFALDPLFRAATAGDYTLAPGSPCAPSAAPHGTNCGLIGAPQ